MANDYTLVTVTGPAWAAFTKAVPRFVGDQTKAGEHGHTIWLTRGHGQR